MAELMGIGLAVDAKCNHSAILALLSFFNSLAAHLKERYTFPTILSLHLYTFLASLIALTFMLANVLSFHAFHDTLTVHVVTISFI